MSTNLQSPVPGAEHHDDDLCSYLKIGGTNQSLMPKSAKDSYIAKAQSDVGHHCLTLKEIEVLHYNAVKYYFAGLDSEFWAGRTPLHKLQ